MPRPIAIGPKNAESMIGHSWRWLRDHAAELRVPIVVIDGKRLIPAEPLRVALEARAPTAAGEATAADELAAMRARVALAGKEAGK